MNIKPIYIVLLIANSAAYWYGYTAPKHDLKGFFLAAFVYAATYAWSPICRNFRLESFAGSFLTVTALAIEFKFEHHGLKSHFMALATFGVAVYLSYIHIKFNNPAQR